MKTVFFKTMFLLAIGMMAQSANAQKINNEKEISNWLDAAMKSYYAGDAEALGKYYAENTISIDYTGKKYVGQQTLIELMKKSFEYGKPTTETFQYQIETIQFLHPNQALVILYLKGVSQMGDQTINWEGYDSMLISKKDNNWQIDFEQNTPVMPEQN